MLYPMIIFLYRRIWFLDRKSRNFSDQIHRDIYKTDSVQHEQVIMNATWYGRLNMFEYYIIIFTCIS